MKLYGGCAQGAFGRAGFLFCPVDEGVRNFVFGHNMSKRCMYANQKETPA